MSEQDGTDGQARDQGIDGMDRALAEVQREEREERDVALRRQADADERIVRALSDET